MNESNWAHADISPILNLEDLSQVLSAERAVVFMSVDWSSPERVGRQRFYELVERLQEARVANVEFFVVNEDIDSLRQRFPSAIDCSCVPLGAGAMHWLERGRIVAGEITTSAISVERLFEKSVALWPVDTHS